MEWIDAAILEPLSLAFMQRAMIIACVIGMVCAFFSCFLVLRGWSLMGDAVSHAVLPGLILSYVAGLPLAVGAFGSGLFCALFTGYIKDHSRVKEDAVMGIVFSGLFALGLVLLTKIETELHLMHVLFGNVLGASWTDVWETSVIGAGALFAMIVKRKDLALLCFDPVQAQAVGLDSKVLHYGLLILLALTIVAALKAAGIILVVAMLIAPGAISFLLTNRFDTMVLVATSVSLFCCVIGTLLSFHLDVATAPLIVLLMALIFLVCFLVVQIKAIKNPR